MNVKKLIVGILSITVGYLAGNQLFATAEASQPLDQMDVRLTVINCFETFDVDGQMGDDGEECIVQAILGQSTTDCYRMTEYEVASDLCQKYVDATV